MQLQMKRMNWHQKPPLHEVMDAWRARRRAMIEEFQSAAAAASSAFATAQIGYASGLAELTVQSVIERNQRQIKEQTTALGERFLDISA
jgi:hypothetical protein